MAVGLGCKKKKSIFEPFLTCSSGPVMRDESHLCSVHDHRDALFKQSVVRVQYKSELEPQSAGP